MQTNSQIDSQTNGNVSSNEDKEKSSILKDFSVIGILLLLSFISIFGIYNNFDFSLISFINDIESMSEKIANYAFLIIYSGTMFFVSAVYWKKKDMGSKFMSVLGLVAVIAVLITIMFLWMESFVYPLLSLIVIGISFLLFNMVFDTLKLKGIFVFLSIFSVFLVFYIKSDMDSSTSFIFNMVQVIFSLLLFVGATIPRIKSLLFKIQTRENTDIDGMRTESDSDDNDSDSEE